MRAPINIVPVTKDLWDSMVEAEATDGGHGAPCATHVFDRAGEIVGATSIFAPMLMFWAHSQRLSPRETFDLIGRVQQMAGSSKPDHLVACAPESPLYRYMTKIGYRRLANVDLFRT